MIRYLLASPLAVLLCAAPAAAETTLCTPITSLPAVISTQGVYCLNADLATNITSGTAILIDTNNVTLDCNDRKLGGLAAGPASMTVGIRAIDRSNITIRNCNIRGFRSGVLLAKTVAQAPRGLVVEDNRLDGNQRIGIYATGTASVVRRNIVADTGNVDPATPHLGEAASPVAILVGDGTDVIDNTIDGVIGKDIANSYAAGIAADWGGIGSGSTIVGNRVRGVESPLAAYGIRVYYGRQVIRDNVLHAYAAPTALTAIECDLLPEEEYQNYPALLSGNTTLGFVSGAGPGCALGDGNIFQ